jgi:hypothetical protein
MKGATIDFGPEEEAMQLYFREGERRALSLGNRGPIRFTPDGKLHPEIIEAYLRTGFYVFEGVLAAEELAELKIEILTLLDRLPVAPGSPVDRAGRPAIGSELSVSPVLWSKPLGDPLGGTSRAGGRHPVKMIEPQPAEDLPAQVPFIVMGPLQFSDAALHVYGHPGLLSVAAAFNGEDFSPFNEALIIKKPGEGASFAWHQDGTTHWERPDWTPLIHGFNFMVQIFDCTAANAVWYLPGSHAIGKVDVAQLLERAGNNRLPDAVPLICAAGDVALHNRQVVHASFPNTSPDWRVTLNMGFHPRNSVMGVRARGMDGVIQVYDEERVRKRSEIIGYAIDARRQHYPEEVPFEYLPHREDGKRLQWSELSRPNIRDYQILDMLI